MTSASRALGAPLAAFGSTLLFALAGCGSSEHATSGGGGGTSTGGDAGSSTGGTSGDAGTSGTSGSAGDSSGGVGGTGGAGPSGGSGGEGAAGGDSGGDGGSGAAAGMAGTAGTAGRPTATCSENPIRTAPPSGKEMFRTEPIDADFPFSQHWMGVFSDSQAAEATRYISMTSLADLDHDGDLDFATGQRHDVGGGMVYWEYCGPDHWVRHAVGTGHTSAAGGNAADVDGDGWVDLLAGNSWYKNPGPPAGAWTRYTIEMTGGADAPGAEELIVGDVTSSARPDVLYVWNSINPQFWTAGADPTATWTRKELTTDTSKRQQQGGAIADIDGDGRNDIVVGYQWWYRNVNADGQTWEAVPLVSSGFDSAPLTHVGDMDGDGDTDVVMCTHFGSTAGSARVAWAENGDGKGTSWTLHPIATGKSFTHAIVAADFDNDADLDIFIGQNVGEQWIYENDGHGAFTEHRIAADSRGHEARVGNVDCDGDLDITGKPWGQQNEGGEQSNPPRDHVYLQNMLVESGGTPRFERGPYELLPATRMRSCP